MRYIAACGEITHISKQKQSFNFRFVASPQIATVWLFLAHTKQHPSYSFSGDCSFYQLTWKRKENMLLSFQLRIVPDSNRMCIVTVWNYAKSCKYQFLVIVTKKQIAKQMFIQTETTIYLPLLPSILPSGQLDYWFFLSSEYNIMWYHIIFSNLIVSHLISYQYTEVIISANTI